MTLEPRALLSMGGLVKGLAGTREREPPTAPGEILSFLLLFASLPHIYFSPKRDFALSFIQSFGTLVQLLKFQNKTLKNLKVPPPSQGGHGGLLDFCRFEYLLFCKNKPPVKF